MDEPSPNPPFPDACRTGRSFITPCCTASSTEFLVDEVLHLAFSVVGHGWWPARPGRVEDINDTGTLVEADGSCRRVVWRADREGC